jgi:hypothetical protein
MRIKDLPPAYKLRALEYQKKFRGLQNPNDFVLTAFDWKKTREGADVWAKIVMGVEVPLIY